MSFTMSVQAFRDHEMTRLERSGWATNAPLREMLGAAGLKAPTEVVTACMNQERWAQAERAAARLREHFAAFRFADDVEYGLLAVPAVDRLDVRGALDARVRRAQQPDLTQDLVDPALEDGRDLEGRTLEHDGWLLLVTVVGPYGISAGSYEDIVGASAERFEVDGVDTRTLMTRQVWGARLLQSPPGVVPDSDYARRWTFTLLPAEGLVGGRAVSGTVLKKRVRLRLGKADRGIGSARVSPALPLK